MSSHWEVVTGTVDSSYHEDSSVSLSFAAFSLSIKLLASTKVVPLATWDGFIFVLLQAVLHIVKVRALPNNVFHRQSRNAELYDSLSHLATTKVTQ